MRATFALYLATGLVLGGATIGPSAGAVTTGHGGPDCGYPPSTPSMGASNGCNNYNGYNGAAPTQPSTPGMGAYNGYTGYGNAASQPSAPGMGAYSGYGTNGVPTQTPPSGVRAPGVRATPPPPVPGQPGSRPLGVSTPQRLVPLAGFALCDTTNGPNLGPGPSCSVDTTVDFTVSPGVLQLQCPDVIPATAGAEQEGAPGTDIEIAIGPCTVDDTRGGTGTWTVSAALSTPFAYSGGGFDIPTDGGSVTYSTGTITTAPGGGAAAAAVPPAGDLPPGGVALTATPVDVLTNGTGGTFLVDWAPVLTIGIPLTAPATTGTELYTGTITHSVT
jgi:hypothetical protein